MTKIKGKQVKPNFTETVTAPVVEAEVKHFRIKHPYKEGLSLVHTSLEGNENCIFVKGNTNQFTIWLPEWWKHMVDSSSVTVQITSIGGFHPIYVKEMNNKYIRIACDTEINPYHFEYSYLIIGNRTDIVPLICEQDMPVYDDDLLDDAE